MRSEGRITPGPHKMGMGFFSCRSALPNSSYLSQPIIETIPKQLKEANYYSTAEIEGGDAAFFRPFFFNTTFKYNAEIIEEMRVNPARFKPLATGIRHQGCAMNVLSFYKFIDTAFARNKVLCLTLRGTSIFRVLEFMNQKLYENNDEPVDYFELSRPSSKKYLIIRYHKDYFMRMFIPSISALNRYQAIVVKFYRDAFNPAARQRGSTSARYSHVGHTVSFYVSYQEGHGNVIYMIDPQGDKYLRVGTPEFEDFLTHFNYYDIIYKPSKKETQKKYMKQIADEGRKIHHIISSTDINKERASRGDKVFIVDYEDIKFGGEKKTAAKKSSPMGVWELETEEADAAAPASQSTRETYKFDGLPYSTPVLAPEVSERAYEHFMNYVRENEIKIPGSHRRTTVAKSRKTGRSGTRRRKTI